MGLGDKIESAAKQLIEAKQNEYQVNDDDDDVNSNESFEEALFSDNAEKVIEDEDFQKLREQEQEDEDADAAYIERVLAGEEE